MRTSSGLTLALAAVLSCVLPGNAESWGGAEQASLKSMHELGVYVKSVEARGSVPAVPARCHACDLSAIYVPHEITWVDKTDPTFVDELYMVKDPTVVWKYWDRVQAATKASNAKSVDSGNQNKALHEACNLKSIPESIARIVQSKTPDTNGRTSGVLVYLRGDSHSRVMFQAIVRALTRNKAAALSANFERGIAFSDHVFCCAHNHVGNASFDGCKMESGPQMDPKTIRYKDHGLTGTYNDKGDFSSMRARAKKNVEAGQVCVAWENRDCFRDDVDRFKNNSLQLWVNAGIGPDLVIVNGGAHYSARDLMPAVFGKEVQSWMSDAARAMESPLLAHTMLVVASSPANGYVPWRAQHVAYEILRAEVGGLARIFPHVAERVSYADLHALAGTNNCGFTTRFPHYAYFPLDKTPGGRDACGGHYWATDAHLSGGAYLHFSELLVGLAGIAAGPLPPSEEKGASTPAPDAISSSSGRGAQRLCDAKPFVPPPDAEAFSETSGPAGENLMTRPLSVQNPFTGKAFGSPTPPGGRTKAYWDVKDAENHMKGKS